MDEQVFQNKLNDMMKEIATLPAAEREKLEKMAGQTQDRHQKLRKTVTDLQESMDYLRLSIKYMMFDLEATRRENNYLRKMIDNEAKRPDKNDNFEMPE